MLSTTLNAAPKTHMPASFTSTEDLRHGLAKLTPELTLREVVYTLCYLSRKGQLRMIVNGQGGFAVTTTLRVFN